MRKLLLVALVLVAPAFANIAHAASCVGSYGNEVYVFQCSDFGTALSTFLSEHPQLEVSSTAPYGGTTAYGILNVTSYYVTFKKKN